VDLVQRRQKLAQIELQLQHEIDQTRSYRNQLRMQYEAIGTADENWVASGSMQARLGIDLQDAAEHPTTRALRDLMKLASIPVQYPHEKSTLSRINHELMTKSDNLVAECAQLAANFVKKGQTAIDSDRLNQFKCMISEVTDLNRALDHHMQHLLAAPTVQSKPKVVQNAEKKGKTPVLEI